jgi:hypothetical protein
MVLNHLPLRLSYSTARLFNRGRGEREEEGEEAEEGEEEEGERGKV